MLPIIFVMPVIQLLILSFAATYELKEVRFAVVDRDQSMISRQFLAKMQASGHFILESEYTNMAKAEEAMDRGAVKLIIHFPVDFQRALSKGEPTDLQLVIDAVDGSSAGLIQSYMASIIGAENREIQAAYRQASSMKTAEVIPGIRLISRNWYNPNLDYITFMVPGILVVLVSMIGLFLSGMNIVREREIGTIEQLNVTPITKVQFMVGKLVPFWLIGMVDLLIGLALARYGFHIPFLGSLATILVVGGIYLILIQALGLFISTVTETQQQAMFIAWFLMVVFILMGGLFTPIESMPNWAQKLTLGNPVAYFIKAMRMVLLKGAGWAEIWKTVLILLGLSTLLMTISINRYKKTAR
jgi:ABC-2 type transport system permease protein